MPEFETPAVSEALIRTAVQLERADIEAGDSYVARGLIESRSAYVRACLRVARPIVDAQLENSPIIRTPVAEAS